MVEIKERFQKIEKETPSMYWSHGTLWIDTNQTEDLDEIKDVMESEVLMPGFGVDFNCLKATKTEPWDQWAMDVVEKRNR
jgi:hypothetical protein